MEDPTARSGLRDCLKSLPSRHVMPGLVPGIHDLRPDFTEFEDVDGRDKPGHDGRGGASGTFQTASEIAIFPRDRQSFG